LQAQRCFVFSPPTA